MPPSDADTKPPPAPRKRLPLSAAIPRPPVVPADMLASATETSGRGAGEREPGDSSAPSHAQVELKVRKPLEVAKALVEAMKAAGVAVAVVLSVLNYLDKAP